MEFTNTDCVKGMVPKVWETSISDHLLPHLSLCIEVKWKVADQINSNQNTISKEIRK